MLAGRMTTTPEPAPAPAAPKPRKKAPAPKASTPDAIGDFLRTREGKQLQRTVTRGILGMLRKRL
jgi:hypothetical protein